ncbi:MULTISPECIES: hypothetical protein [Ramlibacter]|uniref:Biopolymer transporter ExbD n=1 Tax=Ramlibacter aquaticus TaxID=2780094 RepID=A0ABR9SGC3_9BURK|nr:MULTISPECIES: hypothetical protein [Ramlibacter]MBE7941406.1 hypothetical protein [Ramlibacter aquaticus]
MRRARRGSREPEVDPFYDMLFNMLIAFVFCFIIALLAMNPKALKAGDVPSKAEYIITLSWPDMNPNDIDLWVQGPQGELVWFRSREAGLMHLDRDDRGNANDTIVVNGQKVVNPLNQEVVTLRGIEPGEYVVNANYYDGAKGGAAGGAAPEPGLGAPVPVTVSVVKVNPKAEVVFYGQQVLPGPGAETTMARFTVQPDGSVTDINTLPKPLAKQI